MTRVAPRVGVYGLLGSGNIGNDGSFDALLAWLNEHHPDAVIDVIADSPAGVAQRWGLPAVRLHWNRHEYETAASPLAILRKGFGKIVDAVRIGSWVRRHDVVIMAGMGAFEATLPLRPWGTPYSQYLICALGRLFRTRVALVSVGANVVTNPATRRLFVAAARRVNYLSYRDEYSRSSMRTMGLPERGDRVYPDLVYSLPVPPVPQERTGVIGVGVLDYHGGDDDRGRADELHKAYLSGITRLVRSLVDDGHQVRLVTGDGVDERVVSHVLNDLRERRPDAAARVHADPVTTLQELMGQLAGVDVVVATRFHNVVCALKLGKPTVSIGYAAKNDALLAGVGLADYAHRADGFDAETVHRQVGELLDRRPELTTALLARAAEHRQRLDEQFALLSVALFPQEQPQPAALTGPAGDQH
jgi:polysaccharide pyruvyl transferase WcaK-like protein